MKILIPTLAGLLLSASALAQAPMSSGEITKLDKATGRVTLKHGEIKNLDIPPMTMVFRVADPKLLESVAVGDRVLFTADKVNGQYTVMLLNKAP